VWCKALLWGLVVTTIAAASITHALVYMKWTARALLYQHDPEHHGLLDSGTLEEIDEPQKAAQPLTPTQQLLGPTYLTPLVPAVPMLGIVCTMHMLLGE